ncbi:hypothetical protein EUTSA_v10003087mg [Eutrema salsugineum]|uniref:Uncharacterized protein n=1 Tax=Eutrema salsugineum TaxID=72664 RepID=V4MXA8_EUTSA|nr:hypothetical protein EUTSA_v10003087mg [Eutrema salsugineum]
MEDGEGSNNLSDKLPRRVMGDSCYAVGARLNIYSKTNVIGLLVDAYCNSAKLVHTLLSRQLVTTKKHEIWFEFKKITRLNYNPKPDSNAEEEDVGKMRMWKDLFGRATHMTVSQVLDMLKDPELPKWKRLPLALIQNLALTEKYAEMLTDWITSCSIHGVGYRLTKIFLVFKLRSQSPRQKKGNPLTRLRRQLKQQTTARFPLSLRLMALQSIPMLVSKIPQPDNLKTFVDDLEGCQNVITLLHLEDRLSVESDPLSALGTYGRWVQFSPLDFFMAPIIELNDEEVHIPDKGNHEPDPSTRPKKKLNSHQMEKRKPQRKRGRGKNSSNVSEDESSESGHIAQFKSWIVRQNELLLGPG